MVKKVATVWTCPLAWPLCYLLFWLFVTPQQPIGGPSIPSWHFYDSLGGFGSTEQMLPSRLAGIYHNSIIFYICNLWFSKNGCTQPPPPSQWAIAPISSRGTTNENSTFWQHYMHFCQHSFLTTLPINLWRNSDFFFFLAKRTYF